MTAVPFDRSVLKVNQVVLMGGLLVGYLVALVRPVATVAIPLLAVMMLAGAAHPTANLPRQLYLRVLRPRRLVRPRVVVEDPAPHRFAQLLGGTVLAVASVMWAFGLLTAAWVLGWLVVVLALLNFAADICVGCIVYAQLVRAGVLPLRSQAVRS